MAQRRWASERRSDANSGDGPGAPDKTGRKTLEGSGPPPDRAGERGAGALPEELGLEQGILRSGALRRRGERARDLARERADLRRSDGAVQLVRSDGRDVSTLYGREGGWRRRVGVRLHARGHRHAPRRGRRGRQRRAGATGGAPTSAWGERIPVRSARTSTARSGARSARASAAAAARVPRSPCSACSSAAVSVSCPASKLRARGGGRQPREGPCCVPKVNSDYVSFCRLQPCSWGPAQARLSAARRARRCNGGACPGRGARAQARARAAPSAEVAAQLLDDAGHRAIDLWVGARCETERSEAPRGE
jgi:hypothetical protein